ncbi:MAG: hypothetical protein F6J98_17830 [Moorea sp. SIO4G2]|uniref:Uncharacterized protein n=1 Tax=Moorena bouillonii PNG TaxID=568701 RepID=A0A1U7N833_9CYAN|nr:hypothetical protein [Moorena bouillonii]NEO62192.1 hypothetical protein [Moorena sp. SIO4G2]OLT62102.1 hypothetical protein BJP37_26875 [Moorena bouillonii PNG]
MGEYINLFTSFLGQSTQTPQAVASQATQSTQYIAIFPVLTAVIGMFTGLIAAWKNQSDVYNNNLKQCKEAFDISLKSFEKNLDSVKKSYEAEKRALELVLKQKEFDIKNLKNRIQRMESFYAINFADIDKGNTILEKLILLLKYIENRVRDKDDGLSAEVKKMQDYLEIQLGLVDRQKFRFEAVDWLKSKYDYLVTSATEYILAQRTDAPREEVEKSTKQYLKRLTTMLRVGSGTESDPSFIEKTKSVCSQEYVEVLIYIRDRLIGVGGQISPPAYEELQNCIDLLIAIIK